MTDEKPASNIEATPHTVADAGKDEAITMVGEERHIIDPTVVTKAVNKIDWFLIPAMIFGCKFHTQWFVGRSRRLRFPTITYQTEIVIFLDGLVYYDKAILGSAVLFGMTKDLQLAIIDNSTDPPTTDTSRLSWATSLFYFGMLAGLYPMTYALQRFDIGRILGGVVIFWSGVCMLTAAVTTYKGLYAQRFFLGFVESIIPTGFMCIISGYYTQAEQSLRQSWWFSSTGLFTIIGGALNYGFAQITGGRLHRWQYIYLLAGSLTFLFGVLCFFMPNSPVSAWFLTKEERFAAVERLRHGQTGVRCTKVKFYQLKEAVLDVKVWLIFLMMASA